MSLVRLYGRYGGPRSPAPPPAKPLEGDEGHSGRVMGIDAAADGRSVVSCGWDRTVKVWRDPSDTA